jgi:FkbM family methyltransferase
MELIQKLLLGVYSFFKGTGLTENQGFKKVFLFSYFLYKKYIEDPFFGLIKTKPELFRGGYILDIGANIGYTSTLFAKVMTPGFKVYAFEPDQSNFTFLKEVIDTYKLRDKVTPLCTAVGATEGTVELWYNEKHHGDHRIVTKKYSQSGIDLTKVSVVEMRGIDSFVEAEQIKSQIKFIKIDVQGYELPVCLGMERTLAANPDAVIALEYAPSGMSELGFEPQKVLELFQSKNYFIYILGRRGSLKSAQSKVIQETLEKRGYIDIICSRKELLR